MSIGTDILLKIKGTFDSKPVDDAIKKTGELGQIASKAGKDGETSISLMSAAFSIMSGSIRGAVLVLGRLILKIKALQMAMGPIALFAALLASLVALFVSIRDRAAEAVEALAKFKADSYEKQVQKIEEAHARWDAANNRSLAIREASHQFFTAEQEAYKEEALALNELAKQHELSNAASDDERLIIENKFKARANDISGKFDTAASKQEQARLEQQAQDAEARLRHNEKQIAEKQEIARRRFMEEAYYARRASEEAAAWFFKSDSDKYIKFAADASSGVTRQLKDIQALKDENAQLKIVADHARKMAGVQGIKTRTLGVSQEAEGIATTRESADTLADIADRAAKERKKAREDQERTSLKDRIDEKNRQQEAAEERFSGLTDSARRKVSIEKREAAEAGGVAESYRRKGDRKGYAKAMQEWQSEQAEAEAASKELLAVGSEAVRVVKGIRQEIDTLKEQLKRVGQ